MPFAQYSNSVSSSKWSRKKKEAEEKTVTDPYDTTSIDKQISNARMRIEDAGGKVDLDKRNWLERGLNLPEGQNWFFDTLDVLGRPQQALYGAVDAYVKGEDIGKGARAGFTGNQKITGSDFVGDMGVKNKYAKAILGTGLDIVADPVNLIPGAVFAKAGKIAAAPVKGAYKGLESAIPQLEKGKDALGYMFRPQYKWEETLSGGTSDKLKRGFNETNNRIRYMGEESLRNVSNIARTTGLNAGEDVGRIMEKDLQVYGPRPARQMSNDPKVQQAARDLVKSNDTIRQWALDNGVDVGELQGYMTHILSAEERKVRPKKLAIDRGVKGNSPDKKILNARTLQGSAEDINQQLGRKFFEPNAYFATAIGQKRLIEYGNAVKFRRDILGNSDFAIPYQKGMIVPDNAVKIDTNNYKFIKDPLGQLPDEVGGEYIVTKGVKQALDRYQHLATDEGTKGLLKTIDTAQNTWKKLALFSLPYHLRNEMGAKFNNYVGGMSTKDIAKYSALADRDVFNAMIRGNETPLYNEFRQQGLGATSQHTVEFARAGEDPEKAFEKLVKDQSKSKLRRGAEKFNPLRAFKTSQELGQFIDQTNRFALYRWAREAKGMTPEQAAAKVKEVQFDYTNLTNAEREVFARIIPFYRWSRNNIPFQLKQFVSDPRKYMNANKLRTNLQDSMGLEDKDLDNYMRESFYLPVTGNGEGQGRMLGANLPLADLTKLTSPGKLVTDSLSQIIKLPIEYNTNRNMFFNNDIQKFEGEQKKYRIPESMTIPLLNRNVDIPGGGTELGGLPVKWAHVLEQAGGQPVRALSKTFGAKSVADEQNEAIKPSLGISSLFKKYDVKETNLQNKKAELRKLMDYIDYLEQEQGVRPRTVNEIKKDSK